MDSKQTGRKRTGLVVALALCCILAVGGVFAWFSATDTKTNTFIQGGGVTEPEKKPDPTDPEQGQDPNTGTDNNKDDQWIIETEWNENSGITADSIVAKNPNVGIGKDSKDAYVFLEVENSLGTNAYFVLGDNWAPVNGEAVEYSSDFDVTIAQDKQNRCYTSGLFVYIGDDGVGSSEADMAMLVNGSDRDKYTGEAFDKIYTNKDFGLGAGKTIEIKTYLAAKSHKDENMNDDGVKADIVTKAKAWAKSN